MFNKLRYKIFDYNDYVDINNAFIDIKNTISMFADKSNLYLRVLEDKLNERNTEDIVIISNKNNIVGICIKNKINNEINNLSLINNSYNCDEISIQNSFTKKVINYKRVFSPKNA